MRVSMHEFKSRLAQYVGKAQDGETIELTSHKRIVARVIGVPGFSADGGAIELVAAGMATWGGGKPIGASIRLRSIGKPVSAMVLEDR